MVADFNDMRDVVVGVVNAAMGDVTAARSPQGLAVALTRLAEVCAAQQHTLIVSSIACRRETYAGFAAALGLSRQAVWEAHHREVDEITWT